MAPEVTLTAEDITFGYDRRPPVLEGWSAVFPAGNTTAITGPSGRGKSTLLYLLGLMMRPRSGRILLGGTPVHGSDDSLRARLRATRFGFVFQDAALDPTRTVLDNITEPALYRSENPRDSVERAHELMDRFGVAVRSDRKPGQVSGGQAQRIALCRALLGRPPLLLADEPTGNLDPDSARTVLEAFTQHADDGGTVVLVTHDPHIAAACDQHIRL